MDSPQILDLLGVAVAVLIMLGVIAGAIYLAHRTPIGWSLPPVNDVSKASITRRMVTHGLLLPLIATALALVGLIAVGAPLTVVGAVLIATILSAAATLISILLWKRR